MALDTRTLKEGDKIIVTRDGKSTELTVWKILPPGTAGRSHAAGPWIMAQTRPGGFGMGFDSAAVNAGYFTVDKA